MNDSGFDPNTFLDSTASSAFTKRPPLPIGDYIAVIGEMKGQSGQQKKDPSKTWNALNVPLEVDLSANPQAAEAVGGQTKVILFDFVGLDFTPTGQLDGAPGRNVKLRRYREALGQNVDGQPWSPRMMQGQPIRVKVKHEMYEGDIRETVDSVNKV